MDAVGAYRGLPVENPESLQDVVVPIPQLRPRDVLVRVEAVSVNPADVGLRAGLPNSREPRILGFDASGVVEALGSGVSTLAVGDEVWYAGDFNRPGSNAQLQAVDERIVARKPASLSHAEAAALPLTTITAWESLFDHFELTSESRGTLLVMGAAGGVGSIMIQLAKELTDLRVLATASRPESAAWVRDLGADGVVNHHDLVATTQQQAPDGVEYIFSPHSRGNIDAFATLLRPFGHITAIDDAEGLDLLPLKTKSITWHWELMFTRPMFETPDMDAQKKLLAAVASLIDNKRLRTTATTVIDDFSAAGLREAHRQVESGHTVGKVVVTR
ncbi:zinc-binding alcohol dehydrogenase family protein [Streptomyces sp. DvalAA-14]|uniref:zinc-binding alcohol dehydrogenase family protein n=2 Tax=unclassified Streptomyces TaxID=2593676 RepID=UPI000B896BC1|nr:zinc-binding alcohol dehydrogenase family protein [Streptomyces sp. SID4948]